MSRKLSFLFLLLFLIAANVSRAQAAARQDSAAQTQNNRTGAWTATTSSGAPLAGMWTALLDTIHGTVTGTWTLVDAQGKTLAGGAWSAARSPTRWTGAWRAAIAGTAGEYSGTWTARVDLKPNARFADLFQKAIEAVVSGTWRAGTGSGAWSIRTSK